MSFKDILADPMTYAIYALGRMMIGTEEKDKKYLKLLYKHKIGRKLDLDNPQSFNEKIQWLKIYDRKPVYTQMADKYLVRKIIADKIGEQYLIPLLGVWDSFEDIDFDSLPEQFVLKCTHDSGGLSICTDKSQFDKEQARQKINHCLGRNYYTNSREWPYKDITPRIIAEKYMVDHVDGELRDYKFFCFSGEPKALFIATDRASGHVKFDYFDLEFNHLDIKQKYPHAEKSIRRPKSFELMIELAKVLSKGFPHVRVDFYEVDGKVYVGELTFHHFSGLVPFEPAQWDDIFGGWLKLPEK